MNTHGADMSHHAAPTTGERSSSWPRFFAFAIDLVVVSALYLPTLIAWQWIALPMAGWDWSALAPEKLTFMAIYVWYGATCAHLREGRTVGLQALGLRLSMADGSPVGFWRLAGRALLQGCSLYSFVLALGNCCLMWMNYRNTAVDVLFGTVVAHARSDATEELALPAASAARTPTVPVAPAAVPEPEARLAPHALGNKRLDAIYGQVAREMAQGELDAGLMARAEVESGGDECARSRIYMEHRARQLIDEAREAGQASY